MYSNKYCIVYANTVSDFLLKPLKNRYQIKIFYIFKRENLSTLTSHNQTFFERETKNKEQLNVGPNKTQRAKSVKLDYL